jgi:hypothetical protein
MKPLVGFWSAFWPAVAAVIVGVIVGLPFAMLADRWTQRIERRKPREALESRIRQVLQDQPNALEEWLERSPDETNIVVEIKTPLLAGNGLLPSINELIESPVLRSELSDHFMNCDEFVRLARDSRNAWVNAMIASMGRPAADDPYTKAVNKINLKFWRRQRELAQEISSRAKELLARSSL